MSTAFSIILDNKNENVTKLTNVSSEYFKIQYKNVNSDCATLIDDMDNSVIKVTSRRLKFILDDIEQEKLYKKVKSISQFITKNFTNETIGIKYYSNDYNISLENIEGVNVINLQ
jgi:hypothetical protein